MNNIVNVWLNNIHFYSLLIATMNVKNFLHVNQFVIDDDEKHCVYFQSYSSLICEIDYYNKKIYVYEKWNYSLTTVKHFYAFIKEYTWIDIDRKTMNKLENKKIDNFINWFFFVFDKNVKDFEKSLID